MAQDPGLPRDRRSLYRLDPAEHETPGQRASQAVRCGDPGHPPVTACRRREHALLTGPGAAGRAHHRAGCRCCRRERRSRLRRRPPMNALVAPEKYICPAKPRGAGEHDEAGASALFARRVFGWPPRRPGPATPWPGDALARRRPRHRPRRDHSCPPDPPAAHPVAGHRWLRRSPWPSPAATPRVLRHPPRTPHRPARLTRPPDQPRRPGHSARSTDLPMGPQ